MLPYGPPGFLKLSPDAFLHDFKEPPLFRFLVNMVLLLLA